MYTRSFDPDDQLGCHTAAPRVQTLWVECRGRRAHLPPVRPSQLPCSRGGDVRGPERTSAAVGRGLSAGGPPAGPLAPHQPVGHPAGGASVCAARLPRLRAHDGHGLPAGRDHLRRQGQGKGEAGGVREARGVRASVWHLQLRVLGGIGVGTAVGRVFGARCGMGHHGVEFRSAERGHGSAGDLVDWRMDWTGPNGSGAWREQDRRVGEDPSGHTDGLHASGRGVSCDARPFACLTMI